MKRNIASLEKQLQVVKEHIRRLNAMYQSGQSQIHQAAEINLYLCRERNLHININQAKQHKPPEQFKIGDPVVYLGTGESYKIEIDYAVKCGVPGIYSIGNEDSFVDLVYHRNLRRKYPVRPVTDD